MQRGAAAAALRARPRSEPVRVWRHLLASVMTIAAEMRCPQYGLHACNKLISRSDIYLSRRGRCRPTCAWHAKTLTYHTGLLVHVITNLVSPTAVMTITAALSKVLVCAMSISLGITAMAEIAIAFSWFSPTSVSVPAFLAAALPSAAPRTLAAIGIINLCGCGLGVYVVSGLGKPSMMRCLLLVLLTLSLVSLLMCCIGVVVATLEIGVWESVSLVNVEHDRDWLHDTLLYGEKAG